MRYEANTNGGYQNPVPENKRQVDAGIQQVLDSAAYINGKR